MKKVTDNDLRKIAESWEMQMPINIGVKTAFAAGFRMAEMKSKNMMACERCETDTVLVDNKLCKTCYIDIYGI